MTLGSRPNHRSQPRPEGIRDRLAAPPSCSREVSGFQVTLTGYRVRDSTRAPGERLGRFVSGGSEGLRQPNSQTLNAGQSVVGIEPEGDPDVGPVLGRQVANLPGAPHLHRAPRSFTFAEIRGV